MMQKLNCRKIVCATLLFVTPSLASAGSATLTGYGEAQSPAEFAMITVRIKSECYPSAVAAANANDEIANRGLALMRSRTEPNGRDEVTATGGYVERTTYYRPNGQPVCEQQFKKENVLTLKLYNIASFPRVFAELQDGLYAMGMGGGRETIDKPMSFVEISTPQVGLSPETLKSLEKTSLLAALSDAKEKFHVLLGLAGIKTYKIAKFSEGGVIPRYDPDEMDKARSVITAPAPVEFGKLKVKKHLNVEFQYEGADLDVPIGFQ